MCLPYPHTECITWSGYALVGLVLSGVLIIFLYMLSDIQEGTTTRDRQENIGALILMGLVLLIIAALAGELYLGILPPVLSTHVPIRLFSAFIEGYGYYSILILGPLSFMYLVFGLGAITAVITHFLVEQYV
jgi:hypothetical protein